MVTTGGHSQFAARRTPQTCRTRSSLRARVASHTFDIAKVGGCKLACVVPHCRRVWHDTFNIAKVPCHIMPWTEYITERARRRLRGLCRSHLHPSLLCLRGSPDPAASSWRMQAVPANAVVPVRSAHVAAHCRRLLLS